jgi:hypothetical protein
MARNPAVRKAAKAARRKAVVAAKRKQDVASNTPAARVREAARLPVMRCLLTASLFDAGVGAAVLIRGVSREEQHVATFLLDSFCLGVKDAVYRVLDRQEVEFYLEAWEEAGLLEPAEPAELRKLLLDLAAWAGGNGMPPNKDFAAVEALFGAVVPADTDYASRLGCDGKVLYVPGPSESATQVRRRSEMVRSRFGEAAVDAGVLLRGGMLRDEDEFYDEDVLEGELVSEES